MSKIRHSEQAADCAAQRVDGRSGSRSRRWRLTPGARKAMLTLHIVASVALVGSTASVMIVAVRAAGAGATDAHALYELGLVLAFALAIPFSFASLLSGLALGVGTPWGVLRYYWVVAKLALLVMIIATGALAVGPRLQQLAGAAANGLERGALGADRWQLTLTGAANLLFAVAAVVLAVFKPRGRIGAGQRAPARTRGRATAAGSPARRPADQPDHGDDNEP